ncbi:hypothetical protein [Desulfosarcina widdelii]|nr:hypothetical protein [Desulfosarcina widdelii]
MVHIYKIEHKIERCGRVGGTNIFNTGVLFAMDKLGIHNEGIIGKGVAMIPKGKQMIILLFMIEGASSANILDRQWDQVQSSQQQGHRRNNNHRCPEKETIHPWLDTYKQTLPITHI